MDREETSAREWCRQHGYVMMPEAVYEQDITKAYFEGQNIEPCEDAISRKSVIDVLTRNRVHFCDMVRITSELKELPSVTPKVVECEDAISRQAAIDAMYDLCGEESLKDNPWRDNPHIDSITDAIEHLPPVTPKQKMGRWIREKKHHKDDFQEFDYWDVWCSECGARKRIGWTNIRHCPMCGAKMSENPTGSNSEEESEDTE